MEELSHELEWKKNEGEQSGLQLQLFATPFPWPCMS